jgi:hypothetical protein
VNALAREVDLDRAETDVWTLGLIAPSDEGLKASTQLVERERFDQVVVGPQLQALDPVFDLVARRKDQDMNFGALGPKP